ncbi:ABC transporter substrate-binding protein [Hamadaea tsunoensis]|uniref:ABC transporter substrate-binding protein n=1 Tax=Hamadaea tsunoensis TaxID=53368 RepID=UPI00041456DE|nr:ABC transporter substrate-binding protein [Hamadaea tsunoensis]
MMQFWNARRRFLGGAVLALGLLAAGCTSGTPVDDTKDAAAGYDPNADVTITWWTGQSSDAETMAEKLATEFHASHPHITVNTSAGASTTDELLTKLSAGFTSGTYPDVSYAYGSWAGQLAASGRTQNLTQWVADPQMAWSEIPEAARSTATVDGRVIGVPALVDNLALIYNKTLFDKAHVAYPTDTWSWDDFRAAAKQLTDTSKNLYGAAYSVAGSEDTTWHLWPLLWQHGGKILDGDKPAFNSDAGVAALETLRQIAVDDKSMYLDQTDEKYAQLFNDNRIGMMISGPWSLYDMGEAKVDYGVSFLPGYNGDHETISGPDVWVLFDHSDANRAGAARTFLQWLTGKDVDVRWNLGNGNLPLRSSEAATKEFADYCAQYPGAQKFFDNLANAKQARPTVEAYPEVSRYVGQAIASVLQGASTPKEALDKAAQQAAVALRG